MTRYPYDTNSVSLSEFIQMYETAVYSSGVQYLWTDCPDGRLVVRECRAYRCRDTPVLSSLHNYLCRQKFGAISENHTLSSQIYLVGMRVANLFENFYYDTQDKVVEEKFREA